MKKTRLLCGVGINDSDYYVNKYENGKRVWICPYYQAWKGMLVRSYSAKLKEEHPTYEDCIVCDEWLVFSNFKKWMEQQDWEGKELDKDILVQGNKVYSPDTCVFVDSVVNSFILESAASRGEWPLGVHWHKHGGRFMSRCSNPFTKQREHLGCFTCPQEAHLAWKKRKHELACQLADMQIDERVSEALRSRYS